MRGILAMDLALVLKLKARIAQNPARIECNRSGIQRKSAGPSPMRLRGGPCRSVGVFGRPRKGRGSTTLAGGCCLWLTVRLRQMLVTVVSIGERSKDAG